MNSLKSYPKLHSEFKEAYYKWFKSNKQEETVIVKTDDINLDEEILDIQIEFGYSFLFKKNSNYYSL